MFTSPSRLTSRRALGRVPHVALVLALTAAACAVEPQAADPTLPPLPGAPTVDAPAPIPTDTPSTAAQALAAAPKASPPSHIQPPPAAVPSGPGTPTAAEHEQWARRVTMIGLRGLILEPIAAEHLAAGGRSVVLFQSNLGTQRELSELTADISCAAGAPVLVAIDEELSSRIHRLPPSWITAVPSATAARQMTPGELTAVGRTLGSEILAFGVNMDLAPVLDVVGGPNPALSRRHLGPDPDVVGRLGLAFAAGLADAGVVAVAKHFPGHGRAAADPHDGITVIEATMHELEQVDLPPFVAAAEAGLPAMMVGHPIYPAIDADLPASLSPAVLSLLRDEVGFKGVALTDSLGMRAITRRYNVGEAAVAALVAGVDLVLINAPRHVDRVVVAILNAVEDGRLSEARLAQAAARVEALAVSATQGGCPG